MPLARFLDRSAATEPFRDALAEFLRTAQPNARIVFDLRAPPVKVERTLTKILEAYPALPIERVEIDAISGCEHFRGHARIEAGARTLRVRFEWNCRWKAEQLGWTDWFGLPDQARAAREHGYDCFRVWHEESIAEPSAA